MMSSNDVLQLTDALKSFEGHRIIIREWISRDRDRNSKGRHSGTLSRINFLAHKFFGISVSGMMFGIESLDGDDIYTMSLQNVVSFQFEENALTAVRR
jgi:hypothetical protein